MSSQEASRVPAAAPGGNSFTAIALLLDECERAVSSATALSGHMCLGEARARSVCVVRFTPTVRAEATWRVAASGVRSSGGSSSLLCLRMGRGHPGVRLRARAFGAVHRRPTPPI